jgi:hypothetical protein
MAGMSRRAYARSRNIDESTVRKHVKSGTLAGAILPDGTIDPEKADNLLRTTITRGKVVPLSLQVAKGRRERALAMKDVHELHKIRRLYVRADEYADEVVRLNELLSAILRRLPGRLAPQVYGQNARAINSIVKDGVNDLLWEAHEALNEKVVEKDCPIAASAEAEPQVEIDSMTPVELAAHRATTQAEIHERTLAIELGVLRRSDDLLMVVAETQSVMKSRLWALSSRLSTALEHAPTIDAAEELFSGEVEAIIALLDEPVHRIMKMQPQTVA